MKDDSKYFRTERLFFRVGGISLGGKEGFVYKIYSRIVVLSVFIVYPIICTVDLLRKDFNESASDWFYTLVSLMDSTIFIIVFFIRISFDKALRTFDRPSFDANEHRGAFDEERKTLHDWLALSIKFNYTFAIPALLVCGGQILLSLVWRIVKSNPKDWWLPWGSMNLVNVQESPNFELLWFYQSFAIAIYCINIVPMVMVIVGSLTFLTVQLKMLQNYLKKIMDMTKRRPVQNTSNGCVPSWKYLSVYLKDAVEYHLDIINAANAIEDVLHGVFLAFFMYTLSFLCVNIYRASLLAATNVEVLFIVAESLIVYFPTLIICYYGEELAHYSEQVGTVAYQLDFVGTDLRFQKSLILMIQRSQDTLQIKAGRMIGATMNTAVWIIRSAFSAYMMLRTVNT